MWKGGVCEDCSAWEDECNKLRREVRDNEETISELRHSVAKLEGEVRDLLSTIADLNSDMWGSTDGK